MSSAAPATRYVVFSHGLEGSPWGRKIAALAEIARSEGYEPESVDCRGVSSPRERLAKLVETCRDLSGEIVLVGSSLGGYVALSAASLLHARGIFLMAPAIYSEGLPPLRDKVIDCPVTVVHGWHDETVPYEDSLRFARQYNAALHLLDGDHRLHRQIRVLSYLFEQFLITLDLPPPME
jgi:pimeloyl-ACP methyl ester carboxylesterase